MIFDDKAPFAQEINEGAEYLVKYENGLNYAKLVYTEINLMDERDT